MLFFSAINRGKNSNLYFRGENRDEIEHFYLYYSI